MSTEQKSTNLRKYRIEGLDCANCANEIELALRKLDGFDGTTVSFATGTITLPEDRRNQAENVIAEVEPDARIVDVSRADAAAGGAAASDSDPSGDAREPTGPFGLSDTAWRIGRIAVALVLTGIGVLFNDALHATPLHIAEYAVFLVAYVLVGWTVLSGAARNIIRGRVFDEMFLMSVATLGAIVIHELAEAVAVMLFYSVGEYVQDRAVGRSRRSISSLMDLRPDFARLVTDGDTWEARPESVEVGAIIEVRPGERVPLDGEVVQGESAVDTSALTGESVPRTVQAEDTVLSGFINGPGTIRVRVTKPFAESSVSRILELVEDAAARKAPTERFITRFARVYTPIVVAIAALVAFLPPLLVAEATLGEWVYRALVVLVVSCPCALVISIPLGYFGGIGGASRNGILIKGANFLDALKDLSTVVFDKTGTLTHGTFRVVRTVPAENFTREEVLRLAALAEAHSTHPIARSIREAATADSPSADVAPEDASAKVTDVREEKGFGVSATVGKMKVLAGSDRLLKREGVAHPDTDEDGTVVYLAVEGVYAGHILIADELKSEASRAVAELKALGVDTVVMLTGDNDSIAERVATEAGIDSYHAELLPEEKVEKVEELADCLPEGKRLAFVGDGINDAPVIMRSDIGVAMGALGSDAAIEAADIVLMDDRVDGVGSAVQVARHTRSVVLQNIAVALGVKAVFVALGAVGIATMWEAVIADMGISLLAVFNATRTLRYSRRTVCAKTAPAPG